MRTITLELKEVSKKREGRPIFKKLSFSLKKGQWLGLVGENGAGKTTLAKIIVGLDKDHEGELWLNEKSKKNYTQEEWFHHVQIVMQYNRATLDPRHNVLSILEEPLIRLKDIRQKKERIQRIKRFFSEWHLDDQLLEKKPQELSGGQYQRICLILTLLVEPDFLICDEATASLDKINERLIFKYLKGQENMGIVLISHQKELVEQLCDHVICLEPLSNS